MTRLRAPCQPTIVAEQAPTARLRPFRTNNDSRRRALLVRAAAGQDGEGPSVPQRAAAFVSALATSAAMLMGSATLPASAVLNSPNAQIARSVDAALRRSIPAFNGDVKAVQKELEDIAYLLRIPQRKPWGSMSAAVADALTVVADRPRVLAGVPPANQDAAADIVASLEAQLRKLEAAVGSQQPDAVSIRNAEALRLVSELELLQAPGLPFLLPKDYQSLPRLVGRAVVELNIEKSDPAASWAPASSLPNSRSAASAASSGGQAQLLFTDPQVGGSTRTTRVLLTLDGYSAPLSAGAFLKNVMDGLYDNRPVQTSSTSVFVAGPPGSDSRPPVPLEILPAGEFEPVYRLPLDVQNGELPVLPLSIPGAVTFARLPSGDPSYLSGSDWFVYKFDKQQAGLAGLAFDEGTFGVFGYVTEGMEALGRVEPGDVVRSARVVSGADKLVLP